MSLIVSALDGINDWVVDAGSASFLPYWPSLCSRHSLKKVFMRGRRLGEALPEDDFSVPADGATFRERVVPAFKLASHRTET